MATLSCTSSNGKNSYTCTGTAGACGRAIAKLKTLDKGSGSSSPEIAELRVIDAEPQPGDHVRVGLRRFPVDKFDIVVHEETDDEVVVAVFEGDRLVFRGTRPKRSIAYVPGGGSSELPFREALDAEEFIRIDVKDLENRFLV